jgi:DNA-binding NarL/FixJ family response regulator
MEKNGYRILIVDDSIIIIERISEILNELDCVNSVNQAINYNEAETLLAKNEFDVALLDINLPGKNGIELLAYIKENYPGIKTIMLTNQSNDYYRNLCEKIGTNYFIDKSSEFERLPQLISSC